MHEHDNIRRRGGVSGRVYPAANRKSVVSARIVTNVWVRRYSIATSLVGDNALLVQDGNDDLSARAVTKRQQEYTCGESDAGQGGRDSQRHYDIKKTTSSTSQVTWFRDS